jgi:predicted PurR-regulated permease PerM
LIDKRTTSVLFTISVFAIAAWTAYQGRKPLLMLIFGVLFAYLLEPLVVKFQGWFGGSRSVGIALTYFILATALSFFLFAVGPRMQTGAIKLSQELPTLLKNIDSGQIAQQVGRKQGWSYDTRLEIQQFLASHRGLVQSYIGTGDRATEVAGQLAWLGLIPIFAIFVLKGKSRFAATLFNLADTYHDRRFLRAVVNDLDLMLASYIRAQLLLAVVSLTVYTAFLTIIGFPFSFLIGGISGVMEFIPVLGPLASGSLILGIAILSGYAHLPAILLFLLVWRILQDYVTFPLLVGRGIKLHSLAVILGVFVGGEVAGIPGIFLSVPIMATLRILWKNWKLREEVVERISELTDTTVSAVSETDKETQTSGPYCEFGSDLSRVSSGAVRVDS